MHRQRLIGTLVWVCAFLVSFSPRTEAAVTTDQINAAVAKAQKFLLSQRNKKGNWETRRMVCRSSDSKSGRMAPRSGPSR